MISLIGNDITSQDMVLAAIFENSPTAIVVTNGDRVIRAVNPMFIQITGYTLDEVQGKNIVTFFSDGIDHTIDEATWQTMLSQDRWNGEIVSQKKDGTRYIQRLSMNVVKDSQGRISNYVAMFCDVSHEQDTQGQIDQLRFNDQLTGLKNAVALQRIVQSTLEGFNNTQNEPSSAALLILDVDHFKYINDTIDHHIGDLLLIEIAYRLNDLVRKNEIVSRQGGDEFTVFLPDVSEEQAIDFAKEILQSFAPIFEIGQHRLSVTTSVGIALYPQNGCTLELLLRNADIALHQAKKNGKNQYMAHTKAMSDELNEKVVLEKEMQLAIAQDQFQLYYQPVVDIKTGQINSFEALIRWNHPDLGWVGPSKFIGLAEQNGFIVQIGAWVIDRVCSDIRKAMDAGCIMCPVAINLSPRQFQNQNLISELTATLDTYRLSPLNLGIEVTEGVLMSDPEAGQAILRVLKDLGFYLALDDFGTGYSSLSYLKTFSFDKVKIDQSFIRNLDANNDDAAIVVAIINMAHNLGISVVAEGVETEKQCTFLRDSLIDEIQGYMFAKPMPWGHMVEMLHEGRQLAPHLHRFPEKTRTLLLVDDEQNIVSALKRLVRRDGYQILTANNGEEALKVLEENTTDVIISDQRMPGMTGVEFLSKVKEFYPDTIRLMLSGYTELKSVTDAINEGSVFRFLTKPWDDEKLHTCIREAFQYKHYADDNLRLSMKQKETSFQLAASNRQLAELINKKQEQIAFHLQSLEVVREALRYTPVALIGLDDLPIIAFINEKALEIFSHINLSFGDELQFACPELYELVTTAEESVPSLFLMNGNNYDVRWHNIGKGAMTKGKIVTITPR